jgi:hypothetical protein
VKLAKIAIVHDRDLSVEIVGISLTKREWSSRKVPRDIEIGSAMLRPALGDGRVFAKYIPEYRAANRTPYRPTNA